MTQRGMKIDFSRDSGAWKWTQSVQFSPSGDAVFSSWGGLRRWETSTRQLNGSTNDDLHGRVALSPDGKTLAVCQRYDVALWDVATWKSRALLKGHTSWVRDVAYSPDGTTLVSGSNDGTARLWDPVTRKSKRTIAINRPVSAVDFAPDGKTIAIATRNEFADLWDPETGRRMLALQRGDPASITGFAWWIGYSPDGQTVGVASQTGIIRLYDRVSGDLRATLQGHTRRCLDAAFFPDGRTLASVSDDGTVRLWDTATGQETGALTGHKGGAYAVAVSPAGDRLATFGEDGEVRLWSTSREPAATAVRSEADPNRPGSLLAMWEGKERLKATSRPAEAEALDEKRIARWQAYRRAGVKDPAQDKGDARYAVETARTTLNAGIPSEAQASELLARINEAMPKLSGERAPLHALGLAQYRARNYRESVDALERYYATAPPTTPMAQPFRPGHGPPATRRPG